MGSQSQQRFYNPPVFALNDMRKYFGTFTVVYVPVLVFLTVTILANVYKGISFRFFSADPTATLGGHPLTGIQSYFGILVWVASGAISLFTHKILGSGKSSSFFLWSGIIVIVLALDDCFLFHESLARRYLGIRERVIYAVYVMAIAGYLIRFRSRILESKFHLLCLAFGFLGLSILLDLFQTRWPSPWRIFFEDGFKLLGIVSWSGYLIRACFEAINAAAVSQRNVASSHNNTARRTIRVLKTAV